MTRYSHTLDKVRKSCEWPNHNMLKTPPPKKQIATKEYCSPMLSVYFLYKIPGLIFILFNLCYVSNP